MQDGLVWAGTAGTDLSACNVIDEEADVIVDGENVYVRTTPLSTWTYYALIVCAIVLVRGLSNNTKMFLGGQASCNNNSFYEDWMALIASCISIVLVCSQGLDLYATAHDLVFYVATVIYCCAYVVFHVCHCVFARSMAPVFNLAAGVLQLISTCLYAGSETPYDIIVISVLVTRALVKLLRPTPAAAGSALMDALYLSCASFDYDPHSLVAIVACAYMLATTRGLETVIKK